MRKFIEVELLEEQEALASDDTELEVIDIKTLSDYELSKLWLRRNHDHVIEMLYTNEYDGREKNDVKNGFSWAIEQVTK